MNQTTLEWKRRSEIRETAGRRRAALTRLLSHALLGLALAAAGSGAAPSFAGYPAAGEGLALSRIAARIAVLHQASPSLLARGAAVQALIATEWVFVLTPPANITVGNDLGQCGAMVDLKTPAPPPSSGIASVVDSPPSGFFSVGTTPVTRTVTLTNGTVSIFHYQVTVNDTEPPQITCGTVNGDFFTYFPTDPGKCSAKVQLTPPAVTDNCPGVTITGSRADGKMLNDPFPGLPSATPVTWTAVDAHGNTSQCVQIVTIEDMEPPVLVSANDKTVTAEPGQCTATVDVGSPTITDNCGAYFFQHERVTDGKAITDPYPVGVTGILWIALDGNGNILPIEQQITVLESTPPQITCPPAVTVAALPGQCGAPVSAMATATDACGSAAVTGSRSDGQPPNALFPVGTTTITWTATNSSGLKSTCQQQVTVTGTDAPQLTCPAAVTVAAQPGQCGAHVSPTATATDPCGSVPVVGVRSDSELLSALYPVGTTTITWTAASSSGLQSSCQQQVTVTGTDAPQLSCPADLTLDAEPGLAGAHVNTAASASGQCGLAAGVVGTRSDGQKPTDLFPLGTTTITWTATDAAGNQSRCTQKVTVQALPTLTCPGDQSLTVPLNQSQAFLPVGMATAGGTGVALTGARSDGKPLTAPYPVGTTTITWTATDDLGGQVSCVQRVTVQMVQPPAVIVPSQADPHLDAIVMDHGPVGQRAILYGHGFADLQGTSTVTLGGHQIPVLSWSAGAISVLINPTAYAQSALPLDASYPVQVIARDAGKQSNTVSFLLTSGPPPDYPVPSP